MINSLNIQIEDTKNCKYIFKIYRIWRIDYNINRKESITIYTHRWLK